MRRRKEENKKKNEKKKKKKQKKNLKLSSSFLTPLTFYLLYQISPSFYITSVPEDEEFNMALQTEIASELTGTGNTEEDGVMR